MDWRNANLHGAARIARVCGLYEVTDTRVPGTRFKVKILERAEGDFIALLNVCLKDRHGSPDGMAGLGGTEIEALEDALKWFMQDLAQRKTLNNDDFEWSDPLDF
jgi:hypothetical protein